MVVKCEEDGDQSGKLLGKFKSVKNVIFIEVVDQSGKAVKGSIGKGR